MRITANHYEKNLKFLLANNRLLAHKKSDLEILKNPPKEWYRNFDLIATTGLQRDGIWFHSRRDPEREAKRQLEFAVKDKLKHIIFISSGFGYPLGEAIKVSEIQSILLLEISAEFIFYTLAKIPLFETSKEISIYFCENPGIDTLEEILPFFQNKNIKKIGFYKHRASFQIDPQNYTQLEFQVSEILYKRSINQATIIKFQGIWNKNIALNVKELNKGRPLSWLIDQLQEKTRNIVICGAGPSLTESCEELKRYRNNFMLIAADTAFIPLRAHEIFPDIVISADPQWINHYFALHPDSDKMIWVLDPVLCYASSHYLDKQNTCLVWWDNPFYLDLVIRDYKSRGEISHGGSVSTNAFDLAVKLNPERIIFAGQDLSFSQNLAHVKGSILESMIFNKNNRFGGFEMHNYYQLTAIPPREVMHTIHEEKGIYTNDKLKVFLNWFESQSAKVLKQSSTRLYNATKHGAHIRNFEHFTITEILEGSREENLDFTEIRRQAFINCERNINLLDRLESLQKDCRQIQNLYKTNFDLSKSILSITPNKSLEISRQMNRNDDKIRDFSELNKILAINAQSIILKITELNEQANDTEVLFYKFMYISAKKLNYLLKKMVHSLSAS